MNRSKLGGWAFVALALTPALTIQAQTDSLIQAWDEGRVTELFQTASEEEEDHWNNWDLDDSAMEWPEEIQTFQSLTQWDHYLASRVVKHFQRNGLPKSPVELRALHYLSPEEQRQLWTQMDDLRQWKKQNPVRWENHQAVHGKIWLRYGRRLSALDQGYFLSPRTHPGSAYLGEPNYWLLRGTLRARKGLMLGWCAEQDFGEAWQPNGFDHWSGYLAYQGDDLLERLVIGGFNLQAAQGLTIWSGLRMQLSNEPSDPMVHARGLTPYAGALESGSMKGLGFRLRWKAWRLEPFFSKDLLSGQYREDGGVSIANDGLHRTSNALKRKDQLDLQQWGFYLRHSASAHRLGLIYHQLWLTATDDVQQQITRKSLGLEWVYSFQDKRIFTEWTFNNREGWGSVIGAHIPLSSAFKLGSRWMALHPSLHHPASKLLDAARADGRKEWRLAAEWFLTSKITMWWNYQQNQEWRKKLSTKGQMPVTWHQIGLEYRFSSQFRLLLQYRQWEEKAAVSEDLVAGNWQIHRWRIQVSGQPSERWHWRFRWETTSSLTTQSAGVFSFQEVGGQLVHSLRWSARFSVYRIPTYDLRSFGYLPDVSQAMNLPMYVGNGHEWHVLVKKEWKQQQLQIRYTYGGSDSPSPARQDLRIQFIQHF